MPRIRNVTSPGLGNVKRPASNYYQKPASLSKANSPFRSRPVTNLGKKTAKLVDIIALLVLLFAFTYSLIVSKNPKVIVNTQQYHSLSQYKSAVESKLDSITNRNKLTFNQTGIIQDTKKQFPEIADMSVELPILGQKPIVRISVAPATFLLNSQGQTYIVDSQGIVTYKSSELPNIKTLPMLIDQSDLKPRQGSPLISSVSVNFINQLLTQCKYKHIDIQSLTLPSATQELDLKTKDKPYYTKFNMGGNALLQTGQFLAARSKFATQNQDPSTYLDVRVSGKIFYK